MSRSYRELQKAIRNAGFVSQELERLKKELADARKKQSSNTMDDHEKELLSRKIMDLEIRIQELQDLK